MNEPMELYTKDIEITATELKTNLGKYLDLALLKKETIITKNGSKIARLVPYIQDFTGYLLVKEEASKYKATTVSYEEFLEISETVEARMEYINGEIVMQAAPNSFHQEVVGNIHVMLKNFLKGKSCKVFLAPFDVTLYKKDVKNPDVVQPDLLVACNVDQTINDKGRYSGVPTLVIEVLSPTTRSRDMLDKLNTYMRSGCKEYWIIDVEHQRLMQYMFTDFNIDNYELFDRNKSFNAFAFPELRIKVEELFE
jgi:prevent-host-death family protein